MKGINQDVMDNSRQIFRGSLNDELTSIIKSRMSHDSEIPRSHSLTSIQIAKVGCARSAIGVDFVVPLKQLLPRLFYRPPLLQVHLREGPLDCLRHLGWILVILYIDYYKFPFVKDCWIAFGIPVWIFVVLYHSSWSWRPLHQVQQIGNQHLF